MTNSLPGSTGTHFFLGKALSSRVAALPWRRSRNVIGGFDLAATLAALDRELLRLENENRLLTAVEPQAEAKTGQVLLFPRKRIV